MIIVSTQGEHVVDGILINIIPFLMSRTSMSQSYEESPGLLEGLTSQGLTTKKHQEVKQSATVKQSIRLTHHQLRQEPERTHY